MFCPRVIRPSVNPQIPIIAASLRLIILAPTAVPTQLERLFPETSATQRKSTRRSRIAKSSLRDKCHYRHEAVGEVFTGIQDIVELV